MLYAIFTVIMLASLAFLLWPIRHKPRAAYTIAFLFFIATAVLYGILGSPGIVPMLKEYEHTLAQLKQTIIRDSERVKTNPQDLAAWVELGQSFAEAGKYSAAADAFKHAVLISGGNADLVLAYAKAMILDADGMVSDQAQKSLQIVLLQDPDNPQARYFMALRKLQDGNTDDAMQEMKSLCRSLPNNSPLKETICLKPPVK